MIVSEKLNNEDDEFLIKSIFKSFKGSAIPLNPNVKAPKRNFCHEAVTFEEFRNGMRKLPEFVSEVFFFSSFYIFILYFSMKRRNVIIAGED